MEISFVIPRAPWPSRPAPFLTVRTGIAVGSLWLPLWLYDHSAHALVLRPFGRILAGRTQRGEGWTAPRLSFVNCD